MENIEQILSLTSAGVSFLALLLSIILKRKNPKTSKTLEEIGEEAKKKADKYIAKQCKKNKINLDTKSDNNQNNNSTTTETVGNV